MPAAPTRTVSIIEVDAPALVLGSTQPEADADPAACAAADVEVVRRRSGGGAVLLEPGRVLWVDVVVPAGDDLWEDDVGLAFGWLGRTWLRALSDPSVGLPGCRLHDRGLEQGLFGRKVCFAGRGPGEVLDPRGRKVVGISQRRSRAGAVFQCALPLRWEPDRFVELLAWENRADAAAAVAELRRTVAAVPADAEAIVAAFLGRLPH